MYNLFYELMIAMAAYLSKKPVLKGVLIFTLGILTASLQILGLFALEPLKNILRDMNTFILVVDIFAVMIIILSCFPDKLEQLSINNKLDEITARRNELEKKIENNSGSKVLDIIQLNLNQLDEYYTINKKQSKNSYGFSIFTIVCGLILFAITIWIYYSNPEQHTLVLITGIMGVITEFIGATSLLLYKESNKHSNDFIERLTFLQKVMLAVDLAEKLPEDKKNDTIAKIIEELVHENKGDKSSDK